MRFAVEMSDPMMTGYIVFLDDADALSLGVKAHDRVVVKGPEGR